MEKTLRTRSSEILLTLVLSFYVIWQMPIVALYTNTYMAMIVLVLLFVTIFLKGDTILVHTPKIMIAGLCGMLLTLFNRMILRDNLLNTVWAAFLELLPMGLGVMLIRKRMGAQLKVLVPVILLAYAVTLVTTYIGLQEYPMASRELATSSVDYAKYYAKNIGGFHFIYAIVVLHPMIICLLRMKNKKLLCAAYSVLIGTCIIASQYTMATLGFIISCGAYLFPTDKSRSAVGVRMFLLVVAATVALIMAPVILELLAEQEVLEASADKLKDAARVLRGQEVDNYGTRNRQWAYEYSWKQFLAAPLFGSMFTSARDSGGHSYVLDNMSRWGMVGLSVIVYIFIQVQRFYKELTGQTTVFYFAMFSMVMAIVFCIMNPHSWPYELGFVIPVIIYYILGDQNGDDEEISEVKEKREES